MLLKKQSKKKTKKHSPNKKTQPKLKNPAQIKKTQPYPLIPNWTLTLKKPRTEIGEISGQLKVQWRSLHGDGGVATGRGRSPGVCDSGCVSGPLARGRRRWRNRGSKPSKVWGNLYLNLKTLTQFEGMGNLYLCLKTLTQFEGMGNLYLSLKTLTQFKKKRQKGAGRCALRRASAASASPAKHFPYSSKTEAFASLPSLKGALGAPRGEFFKTLDKIYIGLGSGGTCFWHPFCLAHFVMYFNNLNYRYFNTSFIDHPYKKLDKSKTIKTFIHSEENWRKRNPKFNPTVIWFHILTHIFVGLT